MHRGIRKSFAASHFTSRGNCRGLHPSGYESSSPLLEIMELARLVTIFLDAMHSFGDLPFRRLFFCSTEPCVEGFERPGI